MSRSTPSSKGGRRRLSRRALIAFVGLGAALVVAVPSALAIHQFTDVPDANPFHGDIAAISGAGITSGKTCVPPGAPPTYCPTEGITREAMAAFVHRGFGRAASAIVFNQVLTDSFADLDTLTITTGGVAGGTGFLKIDAQVGLFAFSATGCPCQGEFRVSVDGVGDVFSHAWTQFDSIASSGFGIDHSAITGVVAVPTATAQTIRVQGSRVGGSGSITGFGQVTATYIPFGSTGGSTLSVETGAGKVGP